MTNEKTTHRPSTKPGATASRNGKPCSERTLSVEELDIVAGGINPQPLPPRGED
jgi:hypothetical protein